VGEGNVGPTLGDNIARIRRQRSLTQEQLAEAAGVSVETIGKLERNDRTSARLHTVSAIARALGVPTSSLHGDASTAAARGEPDHGPVSLMDLRRALTPVRGLSAGPTADPPTLDQIAADLRATDRAYHANDYATVLGGLPGLLADARGAAGVAADAERHRAQSLVARAHHLTGNLLIQLRVVDLAYCALNAALDAADESGDEVVGAAILQGVCWLLLRQGRLDDAERVAVTAADRIEPRFSRARPAELAAWGWLLLGAAAAAARDNRADDAGQMIDVAAAAAVRIGERAPGPGHLMMVAGFGVPQVEMQRVESAAVAGEAGRVLALAGRVPPGPHGGVSSGYNRHLLDVAWAYANLGQHTQAAEVLYGIRDQAPAWLANQRYARDIVETIANGRRRAMSQEMADLASLVGVSA
jgi:transcriptional regulator with XRE-family HTH domain